MAVRHRKRKSLKKRIDVSRVRRLFLREDGGITGSGIDRESGLNRVVHATNNRGKRQSPVILSIIENDGERVSVSDHIAISFPDTRSFRNRVNWRIKMALEQTSCKLKFAGWDGKFCTFQESGIAGVACLAIRGPAKQIVEFLSDIGPEFQIHHTMRAIGRSGSHTDHRTRKFDKNDPVDNRSLAKYCEEWNEFFAAR